MYEFPFSSAQPCQKKYPPIHFSRALNMAYIKARITYYTHLELASCRDSNGRSTRSVTVSLKTRRVPTADMIPSTVFCSHTAVPNVALVATTLSPGLLPAANQQSESDSIAEARRGESNNDIKKGKIEEKRDKKERRKESTTQSMNNSSFEHHQNTKLWSVKAPTRFRTTHTLMRART